MKIKAIWLLSVASTLAAGCSNPQHSAAVDESVDALWATVSADLIDARGAKRGRVAVGQASDGVLMRITLDGLTPGWHGVHFHQSANCADGAAGFKAAGAHADGPDRAHGLANPEGSETGDLPNIFAGADGRATAELFRANAVLRPSEAKAAELGPYPLLDDDGFAVIVHANSDDHATQPIGGAGDRVACAAISG
jgi:Cu-Zn family superoxide dismutase